MTQVSWDMVGHGDFQWVGAGSAALVNLPIGFDSSSSVGAGAGVSGSSLHTKYTACVNFPIPVITNRVELDHIRRSGLHLRV